MQMIFRIYEIFFFELELSSVLDSPHCNDGIERCYMLCSCVPDISVLRSSLPKGRCWEVGHLGGDRPREWDPYEWGSAFIKDAPESCLAPCSHQSPSLGLPRTTRFTRCWAQQVPWFCTSQPSQLGDISSEFMFLSYRHLQKRWCFRWNA